MIAKVKIKKDIKKNLFVFLENLSFLEEITWWREFDQSKVWLPMPNSDTLRAWAANPKIKLDRVLDQKRNLAFPNELMNLLKWMNVKVYLLLAKVYHQSKKILNTEKILDEEEKKLFLNVRNKAIIVAKNMYEITKYPYYKDIIDMK